MLGVTLFGLIFTPVFYAAIQRLSQAWPGAVPVPAREWTDHRRDTLAASLEYADAVALGVQPGKEFIHIPERRCGDILLLVSPRRRQGNRQLQLGRTRQAVHPKAVGDDAVDERIADRSQEASGKHVEPLQPAADQR